MKFPSLSVLTLLVGSVSAFTTTRPTRALPIISRSFATSLHATTSNLHFTASPPPSTSDDTSHVHTHYIGKAAFLAELPSLLPPSSDTTKLSSLLPSILSNVKSAKGGTTSTLIDSTSSCTLTSLPLTVSRHNTPLCTHAITSAVKAEGGKYSAGEGKKRVGRIMVGVEKEEDVVAVGMAIGRGEGGVKWKKVKEGVGGDKDEEEVKEEAVEVRFFTPDGNQVVDESILSRAAVGVSTVQTAARIVDTSPNFMTVDDVVREAEEMRERLGGSNVIEMEVLRGEELRDGGFGGVWNVGKAATSPPALVVMKGKLGGGEGGKKMSLVGKGITYDTGGLSLKVGGSMVGMKGDLGGAAGVMGAFEYICESADSCSGWGEIELILCVAENCIGAAAFRNDDIITLLSGRTVEINNTDAEGRLVLGDGVARACRGGADVILDMATLTGAQLVSTGKKHAMVVSNDEGWEQACVEAGKKSGDLVHPGLFVPEWFGDEFKSQVADSKNSVKDRMNAQSSCAAHFVYSNLDEKWLEEGGTWIHIDMAGPSVEAERGTGYGVGLVGALMGVV